MQNHCILKNASFILGSLALTDCCLWTDLARHRRDNLERAWHGNWL